MRFWQIPEPSFEKVQLSELFEGYLKDYRFTHPDVSITLEKKTENAIKKATRTLAHSFVNMVDNAVHSLQDKKNESPDFKGKIRISIEDSSQISHLKIIFEDNGAGVDPELRDKIFDPYISSKASGMGLGLAIVRRIAEEHMGSVSAEGIEGNVRGAKFVFELPRWPATNTQRLASLPTEN